MGVPRAHYSTECHRESCGEIGDVRPVEVGGHMINQGVGCAWKLPSGERAPTATRFLCRWCRDAGLRWPGMDPPVCFVARAGMARRHFGCAEHGGPRSEARYRGRFAATVPETD
jgi:hypothetical protein